MLALGNEVGESSREQCLWPHFHRNAECSHMYNSSLVFQLCVICIYLAGVKSMFHVMVLGVCANGSNYLFIILEKNLIAIFFLLPYLTFSKCKIRKEVTGLSYNANSVTGNLLPSSIHLKYSN